MRVRARGMKVHERDRYTLERCSLQAKFLFAAKPPPPTDAPPSEVVAAIRKAQDRDVEPLGALEGLAVEER